jgi:hypothetical protein
MALGFVCVKIDRARQGDTVVKHILSRSGLVALLVALPTATAVNATSAVDV